MSFEQLPLQAGEIGRAETPRISIEVNDGVVRPFELY
jgi:hypothetical protein